MVSTSFGVDVRSWAGEYLHQQTSLTTTRETLALGDSSWQVDILRSVAYDDQFSADFCHCVVVLKGGGGDGFVGFERAK